MFHIHTKNDLVYLASDVLENGAITHGFSTRKGGVSPAPWDSLNLDDRRGDDLANVQENFRRLCTALDTDVQRAVLSRQVHRSDVRRVTAVDCGKGLWQPQDYDSADALVTDVPGIPLIVFSADCNVLLLHDPVRRVIGAAHAGWRGTAAGIAAETVRVMTEDYGCDRAGHRAVLLRDGRRRTGGPAGRTGCGGGAVHGMERQQVAHRPEGRQRPVAAKGRGGAHRHLRSLHRLPPGPVLEPPEDGPAPGRAGRADRSAGGYAMKRALLCLLLALTMLLAAGCADWEVTEDPLGELSDFYQNENEEPEPEPLTAFTLPYIAGGTLDPVRTTDTMQQTVESLMYQGLFALDEQFRPQAVLADSWTYDSAQRTWTIRIKADAAFSDGSAVTAADVAATLERARTSERYAARLRDVTSVYVREDAVVVALSAPLATLPSRLDIPIIKAGTENRTAPTGSGPYLFAKDDTGAYLTANNRWWQDSSVLPLSTIRLQHCKDQDSALYAFTSREVQLLTLDLTGSNSTGVSGAGDYAEAATPVMQFLGMNIRREALSDPALRRALSAGIDRETLVSSCLLGQGTAAQLPASPAYAGYDTTLETPYDTAAYNRLLNAALGEQAEDETPLTLTLLVNEESSFKVSAAQEIAMYLNTARLTVTVEAVPWDTFLARLESGDFDLYYGECRLTADWDLTALLSTEGSLNYGGWSDETTDRLLQAYRSNGADADLVALWQQLLDTAPFAPICFKSVSVVTTEGVVQSLSPTETAPLSPLGSWSVRLDA